MEVESSSINSSTLAFAEGSAPKNSSTSERAPAESDIRRAYKSGSILFKTVTIGLYEADGLQFKVD